MLSKTTFANLLLPSAAALTGDPLFSRPMRRLVKTLLPHAQDKAKLAAFSELSQSRSPGESADAITRWETTANALLAKNAETALPEIIKGFSYPRLHDKTCKIIVEEANRQADSASAKKIVNEAIAYVKDHEDDVELFSAQITLQSLNSRLGAIQRKAQGESANAARPLA